MDPKDFAPLEKLIPELLSHMREDLQACLLCREFVLLKKVWSYTSGYPQFIYYYDDHPDLDNQVRILQNWGSVQDITHDTTKRFVMNEEFADYLTGHPSELPRSEKHAPLFRKEGRIWTLSFEGKTVRVSHLCGLDYIAELLRKPRTPIDAVTLVFTIRENTDIPVETIEKRVVGFGSAMAGIPLTDAKAIKTVKAELARKQGELKDTPASDETTRAKLQLEISKLQHYLNHAKGRDGRPRSLARSISREACD